MLPLEETLVRLGSVGARLSTSAPTSARVVAAAELIDDGAALEAAVRGCVRSLETRLEVAASLFHKQWSVSVARAAVGAFAAERRVPDLAAANAMLVLDRMGRPTAAALRSPRLAVVVGDPAEADPSSVALPDEAALRDWLRGRVVDGHLGPAVEAVAGLGYLGRDQLWGNVAAACAGALAVMSARWGPGEALMAEAAELLDLPGAPTRGLARLVVDDPSSGRVHVRRETCCLHHCLPGDPPPCSSCPLIDDEERARRRAAHSLP